MTVLDAAAALRRLAAHGVPGADLATIDVDSLDQLLILADTQRVLAPVFRAVRAGLVANADSAWVDRLRDRAFTAVESTLASHAAAADAAARLTAAGLDVVVIKGCSTGPLDHANPADRFSSDVDLLVRPAEADEAMAVLGGVTTDVDRGRGWHERFGHARTVVGPGGVEIDVHVRVNHGYVGLSVPTDDLLRRAVPYQMGGRAVRAPDLVDRLLLAAIHSDGFDSSLNSRRDVPLLVLDGGADWNLAVERATRWRVDAFVARGVGAAWSSFDLPPHPVLDWARRHRPTGRQRLISWIPGDGVRRQVAAGPLALPLRRWPAYIGPLLFPSRAYVRSTGTGWRSRLAMVRDEFHTR